MAGKILKVATTDVYGKADDRKVVVFAVFEHTKYMNNYVVFSFEGEYDKKKLYYGSIHLKDESVVVFAVKDNIKQYIDEFLTEYENDKVENFKILDISNIQKVELVSYSEMEYDKLEILDNKSIVREINTGDEEKEKKSIFLYVLLVLLILFAIGLTVLYFKPELFTIKYKELVCTNNLYDNDIMLNYDIEKEVKFDKDDKVDMIDVVRIYTFLDSNRYYEFKDNNQHLEYFSNGEGYKYIDESLQFRVMYKENSVIDDYDEMLTYLKREGFSCIESEYEK